MVSPVDQRRLRDGAEALELPEPRTLDEMKAQLQALWDGAVALQSTDDMGSPDANERVCKDMETLQRRAQALEKRIDAIENRPSRRPRAVRIACGRKKNLTKRFPLYGNRRLSVKKIARAQQK